MIDDLELWSYPKTALEIAHMYTDVRTTETVCVDAVTGLEFDVAGCPLDGEGNPTPDCRVSLPDFAEFAKTWLNCDSVPDCK